MYESENSAIFMIFNEFTSRWLVNKFFSSFDANEFIIRNRLNPKYFKVRMREIQDI